MMENWYAQEKCLATYYEQTQDLATQMQQTADSSIERLDERCNGLELSLIHI